MVLAFTARAVDETELVNEPVITTRLRMNLTMAQGLVQGLTKQIAMAEAAKGTMSRRSLRGHARDLLDGLAPIHADSDQVAPCFRDDGAPGFRDDVAPCRQGSCWLS